MHMYVYALPLSINRGRSMALEREDTGLLSFFVIESIKDSIFVTGDVGDLGELVGLGNGDLGEVIRHIVDIYVPILLCTINNS